MIINHNLGANNAMRNMSINSANASKSMEKLSSGLRINKAGDDAAGLAISEKMRGQIRGLDQASANAQDGISMIQTAEGALNETTSIVQRMRELSVQASSDTNTADDRVAVQKEVTQLKSEIDRIGNTTEFNTTKLIDGSIGAKKAAGVDNAAVLTTGLGQSTAAKATGTVDFNGGTAKIADATTAIDSATQHITVDGATIDFSVTKAGLDATSGDTTGKSFANYLQTQVNAGIDAYNAKYGAKIDKVSVTADNNRISIQSGSTGATSGVTLAAGTGSSAVNNLQEIAGFGVSTTAVTEAGSDGVFTTAGAANAAAIKNGTTTSFTGTADVVKVDIGLENGTHANDIAIDYKVGAAESAAWDAAGKLTITMKSGTSTAASLTATVKAATGTVPTGIDMSKFAVTATKAGVADAAAITDGTASTLSGVIAPTDTSVATIDGKAINVNWTNVGVNDPAKDDNMGTYATNIQTDINDAITKYNATVPTSEKVENVKVSVKDGSFVIQSGSSKTTSSIKFDNSEAAKLLGLAGQTSASQGGGVDFQIGANSGQTMKITVADMRTAALGIDKIDMSTKEGAQASTALLDNALKTVSGQRADLGAFSNRLEHTIANLGTSSENLTSAESRIRDVDMAKEMSTFSKNNILSQAAQAMLAQANQQPQQVLQLLR